MEQAIEPREILAIGHLVKPLRKIFRLWFLKMRFNRREEWQTWQRKYPTYGCPRCFTEASDNPEDIRIHGMSQNYWGERGWIETHDCPTCGKTWECHNGD